MMIISVFFIVVVSIFLIFICFILSMKSKTNYEKLSAYECGFDNMPQARVPFSLRFFLLGIIFVVFDVEMALLIPIMNSVYFMKSTSAVLSGFVFVLILLLGLMHEYREGSLDWVF